ncbi:MAG TPA: MTH1187 family thiamine-binding protein [Ignavibacteriaceae bacterium]|nr:MTH1187 family thiamine-binding protein [Ignavibacteriaceae bacterium]
MKTIIDFCVIPIGVGVSVSSYIAEIQKILKQSGLSYKMHAYGTNVEGEWDDVFAIVKKCHQAVHDMGAPRISTSIRIGTRTDREQTMDDKIKSVEVKLA